MKVSIGDRVRFLNDVGGGLVKKIDGKTVWVSTDDGFDLPVAMAECVVVAHADIVEKSSPAETTVSQSEKVNDRIVDEPVVEIDGGDKLNITVAFEAHDMNRLHECDFDMYLVNDSNYYLTINYMAKRDEDTLWSSEVVSEVEPNTQLLLSEYNHDEILGIKRIALQLTAFKRNKPFEPKAPVVFETAVDSTKFIRTGCYHKNTYFEVPVISFCLVKDDQIQSFDLKSRIHDFNVKSSKADDVPDKNVVRKSRHQQSKNDSDPIVVDLHIDELLDSHTGMSNAEILNYQIDRFRKVMDENIRNQGKKIIFIHGKGEGILRQALLKELNYRYKGCRAVDASFREYGFGATQVTIGAHMIK